MDSVVEKKARAQQGAGEDGGREAAAEAAAEAEVEETFEQIRRLGGVEAEAEARARYAGTWQAVAAADIAQRVGEVAKRAFWDVLRAEVVEGKLDGLWSLAELQKYSSSRLTGSGGSGGGGGGGGARGGGGMEGK